ncbi:MAG: RsiV family protein, partial [Patescibacteria group bacterium]
GIPPRRWSDFVRLAGEKGFQYAFSVRYEEFPKTQTSAHYNSFLYSIYQDTGGAHPNGYFVTFVFDQFKPTGVPLKLSDLFKPGADYLARLSQAATPQVRQQVSERLGSDAVPAIFDEGLKPAEENFQNFTVDGDSLHIFFPPYQVAPYAAGTFDITIPLSSLGDILAPDVR